MDMDLPASVQEIADAIGRQRALYLIGQLPQCGKRSRRRFLCVPHESRLRASSPLVRLAGWDDALVLSRVFGGEVLEVATCKELERRWRDLSIRRLYRQGCSLPELADWFGLSSRTLRMIVYGC